MGRRAGGRSDTALKQWFLVTLMSATLGRLGRCRSRPEVPHHRKCRNQNESAVDPGRSDAIPTRVFGPSEHPGQGERSVRNPEARPDRALSWPGGLLPGGGAEPLHFSCFSPEPMIERNDVACVPQGAGRRSTVRLHQDRLHSDQSERSVRDPEAFPENFKELDPWQTSRATKPAS